MAKPRVYEMESFLVTKKVVLLGDEGVGKTSLFRVFAGLPTKRSNTTQGLRRGQHTKDYKKLGISIWLWDTAGMERMKSLTNSYYRDCDAAILVFDPTNRETINDLNTIWLEAIRNRENPNAPTQLFLVSTKQDKVEKIEKGFYGSRGDYITSDEVKKFVHETGARFSEVFYTTVDDRDGIKQMFADIALKIKHQEHHDKSEIDNSTAGSFHLNEMSVEKEKRWWSHCQCS